MYKTKSSPMSKFKTLKNNGKISGKISGKIHSKISGNKRDIKAKSKTYLIPVEYRRKTRSITSKNPLKKS